MLSNIRHSKFHPISPHPTKKKSHSDSRPINSFSSLIIETLHYFRQFNTQNKQLQAIQEYLFLYCLRKNENKRYTSSTHLYRYFTHFIREVRLIFQGKSFVERHLKVQVAAKQNKQCTKRVVSGQQPWSTGFYYWAGELCFQLAWLACEEFQGIKITEL